MTELGPTPATVSAHSDLVLTGRPFHSGRQDVSLMDKLLIEGNDPLSGEIRVSGVKSAALPVICAVLLMAEPLTLNSMPNLQDIHTMPKLSHRADVEGVPDGHNPTLDAVTIHTPGISYDLVKTIRASILVLDPLPACFGHACVSLPGGYGIGACPADRHVKELQLTGAEIVIEHGYIEAKLADGVKRLRGARVVTDTVTITGTEDLLMAAALTNSETVLESATHEPEVTDLANLSVRMGTRIEGIGTDRLVIQGVEALYGVAHTVTADRIEAGALLRTMATTDGDVTLRATSPDILDAMPDKLHEIDVTLTTGNDWVRTQMAGRPKAVSSRTPEYLALPTGMRVQFMMLNAIAEGFTAATKTIFEDRFIHVQGLNHPGTSIVTGGKTAVAMDVEQLSGATIMVTDLRASASLIIIGLIVQGETLVDCIYYLDRGYDRIEDKLSAVGAKIRCIQG